MSSFQLNPQVPIKEPKKVEEIFFLPYTYKKKKSQNLHKAFVNFFIQPTLTGPILCARHLARCRRDRELESSRQDPDPIGLSFRERNRHLKNQDAL